MFPRTRLPFVFSAALFAIAPVRAATSDVAEREAKILYERANDFVTTIGEGDYSYSYLQFHWKRAQSNVDRVLRVYPQTETGLALKAGKLKLGAFDLSYFKDRVLFRLEEKRLAADNAENCAIFLAESRGDVWDDTRRDAMMRVIEVLSRQKRWTEAIRFPVLDRDQVEKMLTIFRVAARFEQDDLIKQILAVTQKDDLPRFHAIQGEAMALRGAPRPGINALLAADPADAVKLAVLDGMIEREIKIRRTAALRLPIANAILAGAVLKRPEVRDDVVAVAKAFFPSGNPEATNSLATYRAGLGERPAGNATAKTHLAYLEHLAAFEKFDEIASDIRGLPDSLRPLAELKAIELSAQAGRAPETERWRTTFLSRSKAEDAATLAQFRGAMNSSEVPLTVHEKTFASLPIKDPCVLAEAIMEWSLTPNRSVRGAAPYDAVVQKFAPGFENLAAPKSNAARDAASTSKSY